MPVSITSESGWRQSHPVGSWVEAMWFVAFFCGDTIGKPRVRKVAGHWVVEWRQRLTLMNGGRAS